MSGLWVVVVDFEGLEWVGGEDLKIWRKLSMGL